jgi:hypothetical protein
VQKVKTKIAYDLNPMKEEINKNILDDLVLKEINRNGIPGFTKEEYESNVRYGLHNLDWNASQLRYYLLQIYQEKCKRFESLAHIQSKKFVQHTNQMSVLEGKAVKFLTAKKIVLTPKTYWRDIISFKKKYWELLFKIQIKIQFL